MSTDKPAIIALSVSAVPVAQSICERTGGEFHGLSSRVPSAEVVFDNASEHL